MIQIDPLASLQLQGIGAAKPSIGAQSGAFQTVMAKQQLTTTDSLDSIFTEMSQRYDVPKNLLMAVAKAESDFDADSVSSCGAAGIMQLMPETAKSLGVKDSFDPEQNIMGGAKYLSQLLKKYDGDTKLALAAYNAGSGNVAKYGGIPPFKETQAYVKRVMQYCGEDITIPSGSNSVSRTQTVIPTEGGEISDDVFTYQDYRMFTELFYAQMLAMQSGQDMGNTPASMFFLG